MEEKLNSNLNYGQAKHKKNKKNKKLFMGQRNKAKNDELNFKYEPL